MIIEKDARRFITDSIKIEERLSTLEKEEQKRGRVLLCSPEIEKLKTKLVKLMQKINSVANSNSEGFTGRDDLDVTILRAAESIKRRVSAAQSKAVRSLAD